jgi:glucose-6-phosphate isomerase
MIAASQAWASLENAFRFRLLVVCAKLASPGMTPTKTELWHRFQKYYLHLPGKVDFSLDISRMNFPDNFLPSMEGAFQKAFDEMAALEGGAIANKDENRMVGHYWLRSPNLAPTPEIRASIEAALKQIEAFCAGVHTGKIKGASGKFTDILLIGIGGSALGPQFVSGALAEPTGAPMRIRFLDNTDPDGIDRTLASISNFGTTVTITISKSGGTKETRNGMLEAKKAFESAGMEFGAHAVAVTSAGSELDKVAIAEKWLARFPMWDWVGGRTSELSPVGLLPAALQGISITELLEGARNCDEVTRSRDVLKNPAALLAAMWFFAGDGKGSKNMVVLPYKDRLVLFSKYLQQLLMESLGKELDRSGKRVNQGITVLGNKGSTDQHSYVQQLREGLDNFFVIFIQVLRDRKGNSMEVEPGLTSGDYLEGFLEGTRQALYENGRGSMTLRIGIVNPLSIGYLIALFERAVGLYASLINVNAYHQPGVEAGKKAAATIIELQRKIVSELKRDPKGKTVTEIATGISSDDQEMIWKICEHLVANPDRKLRKVGEAFDLRYFY